MNLTTRKTVAWRLARASCALVLIIAIIAPFPLAQAASSALKFVLLRAGHSSMAQDDSQDGTSSRPSRNYVPRIKLFKGNTREIAFGEPVQAVMILDPHVASVETKSGSSVIVTALTPGETILIISGQTRRSTYVIQVMRPLPTSREGVNTNKRGEHGEDYSGFYSLYFSPGFNGAPSLVRHNFEFNQKLTGSRTLRASGEMFNFLGRGERALSQPLGTNFGMNRMRLGIDSRSSKLDLLDSELDISRLSFNNYTIRGPHFISQADSRWRGLEVFAGRARPQLSFFNEGEGLVAGALLPVAQGPSWRARAGAILISPQRRSTGLQSGIIWQTDVRYSPDERTTAEAEMAYAQGGLSWRTRFDVRRGTFNFYSELFRLDRRSPLVAVGAQSSGRKINMFGLNWRPIPRFGASLSYNSTTNLPLYGSRRVELNSRTLIATASYIPHAGARLGFSFNQQELETPTTVPLPFLLSLQTRAASIRYSQRIARHWTNDLEARSILGREENTSEQTTRGFSFREQLRYSWRRGSIAGFVNYRTNTPSLTGLIVRNPQLLPVELRSAFVSDPARFLLTNRDALPQLLPNVELPLTRSTDVGLRFQAAFLRLNLAGEVRYSVGEILARDGRNVLASFSANLKLDAANSLQFSGARSFAFNGAGSQNVMTISYTHRFGADSGGGFQFSKLFGLTRGRIQGRVFLDTNGNGQDDPQEPGVAGTKVQLDGNHAVTTDANGRFCFNAIEPGEHNVALAADELGIKFRATDSTLRQLFLSSRETVNVSFGVTNFGFVAGRVFNDLQMTGRQDSQSSPGVGGVRVLLRPAVATSASTVLTGTVNTNGAFEFRNLSPGSYRLEMDTASLPADYKLPEQASWPITVSALAGFYLDIPLQAQRAASGVVFIDRDGDGLFDPLKDEAVAGARVMAGGRETLTDKTGSYILRNLPAGKIEIYATAGGRNASRIRTVELSAQPVLVSGINLSITR